MKIDKILLIFILLAGVTSCATQRSAGGFYTSPDGFFTCQVPASNLGWISRRETGHGCRGTSWWNDFDGELYKIELIDNQLLPPAFQKLSAKDQAMQSLDQAILPNIRSVCPLARMLSKRYLPEECGGGALGVINVPGGSPVIVTQGIGSENIRTYRPEVTRNVFVFRSGRWLVIVTHIGEHLGAILNRSSRTVPGTQSSEKALASLLNLARSIRVMKP